MRSKKNTSGCEFIELAAGSPEKERVNASAHLYDVPTFLKSAPLFSSLSEFALADLASRAVARSFGPGQTIFSEGEQCESLLLIRSGAVRAFKVNKEGKLVILRIICDGALLGEVALFDRQPYPASAEALDFTACLEWSRESFTSFLKKHPEFAIHVIGSFARRLRASYFLIQRFATSSIEDRVGSILLKLATNIGEEQVNHLTKLSRRVSRQDLAEMAGCTPESVCRVTAKFKRLGMLGSERGHLTIAPDGIRDYLRRFQSANEDDEDLAWGLFDIGV